MVSRQSIVPAVCMSAVFLGMSSGAIGQGSGAQDIADQETAAAVQAFREFLQSQSVSVDGSVQPQLIPERVRVRNFSMRLVFGDVGARLGLSDADAALVEAFTDDVRRARVTDEEAFKVLLADRCDAIAGKSVDEIDGVALAARVAEVQQRSDAALVLRFMAMMNAVSPAARKRIEDFIEADVVAGMHWSETDWLAIATQYPESAAMNAMRACAGPGARPEMRIITSSSRSGGIGLSVRLGQSSSVFSGRTEPQGETPEATITFRRVVAPSELRALLAGRGLELRGIDYHEVGPFVGHFSFRPGVDAATAISAAEEQISYRHRAAAYAAARGAASVFVPGIGPMGTAQPLPVDRGSGRFDSEQALRPTREELDAMSLPPCIADERIEQPFDVEGPDRAMMEAACGLRPYAITVVGDRELVDAFAGARGDAIASVVFDPPTD